MKLSTAQIILDFTDYVIKAKGQISLWDGEKYNLTFPNIHVKDLDDQTILKAATNVIDVSEKITRMNYTIYRNYEGYLVETATTRDLDATLLAGK